MTGRSLFKKLDKISWLFYPICKVNIYLDKINGVFANLQIVLRYYKFRLLFKSTGTNVSIHNKVIIKHPENINIGSNVSIHPLCYLDAEGNIEIGNNVSIAHNTTILSSNHTWQDPATPIKYNPKSYSDVIIEDDVWIGCGVRIMGGVRIRKRCVIAAGAVVTKECKSNALYAGVPARFIKAI